MTDQSLPLIDPEGYFEEDFHEHTYHNSEGRLVARVEFDAIEDEGGGKLFCEASVYWLFKDPSADPLIRYERVNLLNSKTSTGWTGLAKTLEGYVPDVAWEPTLRVAVHATIEEYRKSASRGGYALPTDPSIGGSPFILEPFVAAEGITVLYGPHGGGKSVFCLGVAVAVGMGLPVFGHEPATTGTVVYVDFEDDSKGHTDRMWAMAQELGYAGREHEWSEFFHHERIDGSLRDVRRRIRNVVRDTEAVLVIVDSVGLARGGDVNSSDPTIKLFKTLRSLGVPVLAIDHIRKELDEKIKAGNGPVPDSVKAIGSQYTMSSARLAWFYYPVTSLERGVIHANVHNTKHNHVAKQDPQAVTTKMTLNAQGQATSIKFETPEGLFREAMKEDNTRLRIIEWLEMGAKTGTQLAEVTGINPNTIRGALKRELAMEPKRRWFDKWPDKKGRGVPYRLTELGSVAFGLYVEGK